MRHALYGSIAREEEEGLRCIEELATRFGKDLSLGAGTVLRPDLVDRALNAGATYLITPAFDKELIAYMLQKRAQVFPGVFSPADIMQALNMGITQLKLFPVADIPADFIKHVKGPFPRAEFIGVGGVSVENIADYYHRGCRFFGLGSDLIPRGADPSMKAAIATRAKAYLAAMAELKA